MAAGQLGTADTAGQNVIALTATKNDPCVAGRHHIVKGGSPDRLDVDQRIDADVGRVSNSRRMNLIARQTHIDDDAGEGVGIDDRVMFEELENPPVPPS